MMAFEDLTLDDIPNEILVSILSGFDTQALLPLAVVSRRFHSIILRILHFRLLLAAALPEYKLILEAYHPSRRYTEPYNFCTYLGTDGLSSKHEGEGSLYEGCIGPEGMLAKLGALYSRFRPEKPGIEGSMPARRFAGATPSQAANGGTTQPIYANGGDGGTIKILHNIHLDADELFGQFCAYSSLVRLGPRRGVFLSTVPIVEQGQGVMRVWREWLVERAREQKKEDEKVLTSELNRRPSATCPVIGQNPNIIWTDYRRNVGLKVAVRCNDGQCHTENPDLDDIPLRFTMEITELVVRTTHLMLAVEASVNERQNQSGKALIFGNFAVANQTANYSTSGQAPPIGASAAATA